MRFAFTVIGLSACWSLTLLNAQVPAADTVHDQLRQDLVDYFSPPTYVTAFSGGGIDTELDFESGINPHITFQGSGEKVFVQLTPRIIVRMFNEESHPVKTPSYMPRLTIRYFPHKPRTLQQSRSDWLLSLMISHHSNGQAGPFLNPDGTPNTRDGSFSTNFARFSVSWLSSQLANLGRGWLVQGGGEIHPPWNQSEELKGRYGRYRLHLEASYKDCQTGNWLHSVRLRLTGLCELGELQQVRFRDRYILDIWYGFKSSKHLTGLEGFINFYRGQDFYNIRFTNHITVIRFGLSLRINAPQFF